MRDEGLRMKDEAGRMTLQIRAILIDLDLVKKRGS
jgi:hypothetical protein